MSGRRTVANALVNSLTHSRASSLLQGSVAASLKKEHSASAPSLLQLAAYHLKLKKKPHPKVRLVLPPGLSYRKMNLAMKIAHSTHRLAEISLWRPVKALSTT